VSRDSRHPADPVHLQDSIVVDVTLVDAMLALTPAERLRANDRMIRTVEELRHGFAIARTRDAARQAGGERD
jgi:hypothetical protein